MLALGCLAGAAQATPGVWISVETRGYADPAEALAAWRQGHFRAMPESILGLGGGSATHWLVVERSEAWPKTGPMAVSITPVPVASLAVWAAHGTGGELHTLGRNGMAVPADERASRTRLATVTVPDVTAVEGPLVLRVETIAVQLIGVSLQDTQAQVRSAQWESAAVGAAACLSLGVFGLALGLFLLLRLREVLEWTLLMALVASLLLSVNGLLLSPIEALFRGHYEVSLSVLVAATAVTYCELALKLFNMVLPGPRWLHLLRWSIWGVVPAGLLAHGLWGQALLGILSWNAVQMLGMAAGWAAHRRAGGAYLTHHAVLGTLLIASLWWFYLGLAGFLPFHVSHFVCWQVMLGATFLAWFADLVSRAVNERQAIYTEKLRLHALLMEEKQQLEQRVEMRTAELRSALSDVQRFEAHQRELLSLASHEFRTPAAMIKSALDVMSVLPEDYSSAAQTRLETIRSASNRLIFLANKLIEHDRWREMSVKPKMDALDLRLWIHEVMADVPTDMPVHLQQVQQVVVVKGDAVLLRIALQNLIDNALAHVPRQGGEVKVGLNVVAGWAHLVVDDNGPGVPDEVKPQVFDRFFSGRSNQRHGLGLSIVRAVSRLHGGDATVADAPGGGARFVISLPLQSHALSEPSGESEPHVAVHR